MWTPFAISFFDNTWVSAEDHHVSLENHQKSGVNHQFSIRNPWFRCKSRRRSARERSLTVVGPIVSGVCQRNNTTTATCQHRKKTHTPKQNGLAVVFWTAYARSPDALWPVFIHRIPAEQARIVNVSLDIDRGFAGGPRETACTSRHPLDLHADPASGGAGPRHTVDA